MTDQIIPEPIVGAADPVEESIRRRLRLADLDAEMRRVTNHGRPRDAHADWSDQRVAGQARMLYRDQLDHEAICVTVRDRILSLVEAIAELDREIDRLRHPWFPIGPVPDTSVAPWDGRPVVGRDAGENSVVVCWRSGQWEEPVFCGRVLHPQKFVRYMPIPKVPE